ncbi:MAG TPA: sulfatase/phosphatase domain-containing protein, partial [Bryobacteraceae bacterium]|nr:sulfatase/phosphatase domain-containing protein [Bryobacteraceae bacterium]
EKLGSHRPAGRLRGGKYSNFDGGTRVPFIARWPGQIRKDTRSDALVSQVDFLATMAALTGQQVPANAGRDGVNVLPALLGKSKTARRSLVEHAGVLSLVEGNWKLIEGGKGPKVNPNTNTELGNDAAPQLYDIGLDPGETTNRAAEYPDVVEKMLAELKRIRAGA